MSFFAALLLHTAVAGELELRDQRGRPVQPTAADTLVFWSMDCVSCVAQLRAATGGPSRVIALNVDPASASSRVAPFLHSVGVDAVSVLDPEGEVSRRLGASKPGTMVGLTPDGVVAWRRAPDAPAEPTVGFVSTAP